MSRCAHSAADPLLRNPITGIVGCCARTASGHAAAAPARSVMKSRRLMWVTELGTSLLRRKTTTSRPGAPSFGSRWLMQKSWVERASRNG